MTSTVVADWFGEKFASLHPLLQALHTQGGTLRGQVLIDIPSGVGGLIGRRLAQKLGVPSAGGTHQLVVHISHEAGQLHWNRCFNNTAEMKSTFEPVGTITYGYWLERTGPLAVRVTVDIIEGGWHWRCLSLHFMGIALPLFLFPKSRAYKIIESEKYRFYVGFSLPVLGTVLSYSGLLVAELGGCPVIEFSCLNA